MWGKINDVLSDPKSENRDLALPIMYFLENAINERSNPMSMGATAIASAIKKGKVIRPSIWRENLENFFKTRI